MKSLNGIRSQKLQKVTEYLHNALFKLTFGERMPGIRTIMKETGAGRRTVMHALEICYMTGRTYTSYRTRKEKKRPFNIIKIGLQRDREELYERINRRVDIMMEQGLLQEAKRFYHLRNHNSLNTVGYKEIFKVIDGEWELPFAIEKIKQNTRIYSRKQTTWYRKSEDIAWFHPNQREEILQYIDSNLK